MQCLRLYFYLAGWTAEHPHWESLHLFGLHQGRVSGSACNTFNLRCFWVTVYHLGGLVERHLVREQEVKRSNPTFPGGSYQWLNMDTPVAALPGTWLYIVSVCTGWPGISILWLDGTASVMCNFCLRVAACTVVWAYLWLRYILHVAETLKQPTSRQTNMAVIDTSVNAPHSFGSAPFSLAKGRPCVLI